MGLWSVFVQTLHTKAGQNRKKQPSCRLILQSSTCRFKGRLVTPERAVVKSPNPTPVPVRTSSKPFALKNLATIMAGESIAGMLSSIKCERSPGQKILSNLKSTCISMDMKRKESILPPLSSCQTLGLLSQGTEKANFDQNPFLSLLVKQYSADKPSKGIPDACSVTSQTATFRSSNYGSI